MSEMGGDRGNGGSRAMLMAIARAWIQAMAAAAIRARADTKLHYRTRKYVHPYNYGDGERDGAHAEAEPNEITRYAGCYFNLQSQGARLLSNFSTDGVRSFGLCRAE